MRTHDAVGVMRAHLSQVGERVRAAKKKSVSEQKRRGRVCSFEKSNFEVKRRSWARVLADLVRRSAHSV